QGILAFDFRVHGALGGVEDVGLGPSFIVEKGRGLGVGFASVAGRLEELVGSGGELALLLLAEADVPDQLEEPVVKLEGIPVEAMVGGKDGNEIVVRGGDQAFELASQGAG